MCGLVFALATRPVRNFVAAAHMRQHHRGPDGEGVLFEETVGVHMGMAHERLAIVGLSDSGAQPMLSASGRYRVLFNGEVYNFQELAERFGLNGLHSGTDTEVVVELIERLGIDEACRHFNGMWAMVVQDCVSNRFYVSRDRFGKKPLYMHRDSSGIYLASEMHSMLALPGVDVTPDAVTAARFLSQSLQNLDEHSWVTSIKAFPAAMIGEIDGTTPANGLSNLRAYWKPGYQDELPVSSDGEAIEELRHLVQDAIRLRLHADVPVGVALSGGIDSSIIAAQAKHYTGAKDQITGLFSAVNPGSKDDESSHIDVMAQHLGSEVSKFQLDPEADGGLFKLLETCTRHNDGPVTSFSNMLFYKLMESAREAGITVVLTGQGADEAFCGYRKYPILEIKRLLKARRLGAATALASGFLANGTLLPQLNITEAKRYVGASNKSVLGEASLNALDLVPLGRITSLGERQWLDVSRYSVPYLCHYEDRMSMAWSREVRAPFLDYRVVDMGMRMPRHLKMARGWTKYALRRAFEPDLPASITWRKDKKGFVNPQDKWLKGPLQETVRDIMGSESARVFETGLVDRAGYMERFDNYCAGRGNVWFRDVFGPFALELWLRNADEMKARALR